MKNDFNIRFGLSAPDIEELKIQFVHRVNSHLFGWLENDDGFWKSDFVPWISLESGEPWNEAFTQNHYDEYFDLSLKRISGEDFLRTLWLIEKCYYFIKEDKLKLISRTYIFDGSKIVNLTNFDQRVGDILSHSDSKIGIFWKEGKFYKAGAKELDEALIKDNLEWLNNFPKVKSQYNNALKHFKESLKSVSARKDTITNAYSSIEKLTQTILNNKSSFDKNSDKLVKYLELPKEYRNIIHFYKQIANEYSSRHAGSEFGDIETEAFIYMTGLLMRLIARKVSS